ncbi:hypothetical protein NUACC26_021510 [Scytonema sp. NUACC26]
MESVAGHTYPTVLKIVEKWFRITVFNQTAINLFLFFDKGNKNFDKNN